ncbi:MAG: YceI family protein [Bacteroidales bacterium]
MKGKIAYLTIILCTGAAGIMVAQERTWDLDPGHSDIGFTANFMLVSTVSGEFTDYTGTIVTEGTDFEGADIRITIRSGSIDTDNDLRDEDLRGESFLYVEEYPEITFESISFTGTSEDLYELEGELTIRGVTRRETLQARYNGTVSGEDQLRAGFRVTGTIDRFDYGVDWNSTFSGGLVVSREVRIRCAVSLVSAQ